jgi:cytochrome c
MTRTRTTGTALAVSLAAVLAVPAAASARTAGNVPIPDQSRFQKVTLNDRPGEPMSLAVLPDSRVLHSARTGEIRIHNPRTGLNTLVADMKLAPKGLYQHDEEGMQGVAVDPDFSENRWVYVYYSPKLNTPVDIPGTGINEGDAPETLDTAEDRARLAQFAASPTTAYLQLSRFKLVNGAAPGTTGTGGATGARLDFSTEQEILRVPSDRGLCCHVGGQIEFDGAGNLYLSTGDDTNPFQSAGYTPLDDRPNRNPAFDARRTAGNTNDLRGKVLRIRVGENGGYTIPNGNMFRRGLAQTRPEIYVMGLRNPFRFAVNKTNGHIYLGDYSPDANKADPARGPAGTGRWMLITRPANYGWPFCMAPDLPYVDHDFTPDAAQSGDEFNCNRTINDSLHNTGQRVLPQVVRPDVIYSYPASDPGLFPELLEQRDGDGIGPMGGPAYQFDRTNRSPNRFPRSFHGQPIFYEWTRDHAKLFELNRPNGTRLEQIHNLFGGQHNDDDPDDLANPNIVLDNPMDMEFGPDGALYVLEYGTGYFAELPAAQLARIDFVRGNEYTPEVEVAATPSTALTAPLEVQFSSAGTQDPDGDRIAYAWDFDSNGTVDSREANPTFTYTAKGVYEATLRVTDSTGRSASSSAQVTVGNQAPTVEVTAVSTTPPFNFGDTVTFTVTVTDDQPVDCSRVSVGYVLGHDQHGHPQTSTSGCTGEISIPIDEAHQGQNIAAVIVASYADAPGGGEESQTGNAEVVLRAGTTPSNQG